MSGAAIPVAVSRNQLIDRLRSLQSRRADENEHDDALLLDLAIQVIERGTASQSIDVVGIVKGAIRAGFFDRELHALVMRQAANRPESVR